MLVAVTEIDRDDGSSRTVAEGCRDLPAELVDQAFADALNGLLGSAMGDPRQMARILGVAEDFVHVAGRGRFGYETKSLVSAVLAKGGVLSPERAAGEPVALASARAFALELNVTLGRPLGLGQLADETLVRDLAPGLWLDLARDQLTPAAFLDAVAEGFRRRSLTPADLVIRLPGILARQGGAAAQSALDLACQVSYAGGLLDEAADLVARANSITHAGFTQAPGHTPPWARGHETVDQLVAWFVSAIRDEKGDTRTVYREMRMTLDPVLCHCNDPDEEVKRQRHRAHLVDAVENSPFVQEYRFIASREAARPAGGPSRHWWWMAISEHIGLKIPKKIFEELSLRMPNVPFFPYGQEPRDEYDGHTDPLFRLLRGADSCGLR